MWVNHLKIMALSTMLVFTYGCSSTIKGESDFNTEVNFAQYESFAWISDNPLISAPRNVNPINVERIHNEIVSVLTAKGYQQVQDPTTADFTVSFTIGRREQMDIDTYPVMYGGPWQSRNVYGGRYYSSMAYETYVDQYTEGILAIDLFDVNTKSPAWHGWAKKRLTASVQRDAGPVITEAVNAILRSFPP